MYIYTRTYTYILIIPNKVSATSCSICVLETGVKKSSTSSENSSSFSPLSFFSGTLKINKYMYICIYMCMYMFIHKRKIAPPPYHSSQESKI
jgi:hypothetical protein